MIVGIILAGADADFQRSSPCNIVPQAPTSLSKAQPIEGRLQNVVSKGEAVVASLRPVRWFVSALRFLSRYVAPPLLQDGCRFKRH